MKVQLTTLFILGFITLASHAEDKALYTKNIHLEWEPIPNAIKYEIEFKGDTLITQTATNTELNVDLPPGKYKIRTRSIDDRGVPSRWSPEKDFQVQLDAVSLISPSPEQKVKSNEDNKDNIKFSWKSVPAAEKYRITIYNSNKEIVKEETTDSLSLEVELPVANYYTWQVMAIATNSIESEAISSYSFELVGKKLTAPNISDVETKFVRELAWSKPDRAEKYSYVLYKKNKIKKYEEFKKETGVDKNNIPFLADWPGGIYILKVRAEAPNIAASNYSKIAFEVVEGDRSPAAEYAATIRQSIDRTQGWYGIASYFISMIKYHSINPDAGSAIYLDDNAIGGTGRLGLGWFSEKTPWGFLGIIDASGFSTKDQSNNYKTRNYGSLELSSVYRKNFLVEDELRIQMGIYNRTLVELYGDLNSPSERNISAGGLHLGAEYWYSLSSKLGLQGHAHTYYNTSANVGGANVTSKNALSYQYGILGSYRMNKKWTGLAGLTIREDIVSYLTSAGSTAETSISGNYLNFYMEYDF